MVVTSPASETGMVPTPVFHSSRSHEFRGGAERALRVLESGRTQDPWECRGKEALPGVGENFPCSSVEEKIVL